MAATLWSLYKQATSGRTVKRTEHRDVQPTASTSKDFVSYSWMTEHFGSREDAESEKTTKHKAVVGTSLITKPTTSTMTCDNDDQPPVMKKWANYKSAKQSQLKSDQQQQVSSTNSDRLTFGCPIADVVTTSDIASLTTTTNTNCSETVKLMQQLTDTCQRLKWDEPTLTCETTGAFPKLMYRWTVSVNGVDYRPPTACTVKHMAKLDALKVALRNLGLTTTTHSDNSNTTTVSTVCSNTNVDKADTSNYSNNPGMKLMMRMGYEPGEGLGTDSQGIPEPIQVQFRHENNKLAIGAIPGKKKKKKKKRNRAVVEAEFFPSCHYDETVVDNQQWPEEDTRAEDVLPQSAIMFDAPLDIRDVDAFSAEVVAPAALRTPTPPPLTTFDSEFTGARTVRPSSPLNHAVETSWQDDSPIRATSLTPNVSPSPLPPDERCASSATNTVLVISENFEMFDITDGWNPLSLLCEYCQYNKFETPYFQTDDPFHYAMGKSIMKTFVTVNNIAYEICGSAVTKEQAKTRAAQAVVEHLGLVAPSGMIQTT